MLMQSPVLSTVPIPKDVSVCKGCSEGKMTSLSFPDSTSQATEPFGLVHSNLKQFPIQSYHKYKYLITFYDDYTSHGWISFLKSKDQAYQAIVNFLAVVKMQFKSQVHGLMTNASGEFTSLQLKERLQEQGIKVYQSIPHMPQQNGHAEHFNRTIMDKAEAMRHQACLARSWWEFCVEYVIHIYNRTPSKRLKNKTP